MLTAKEIKEIVGENGFGYRLEGDYILDKRRKPLALINNCEPVDIYLKPITPYKDIEYLCERIIEIKKLTKEISEKEIEYSIKGSQKILIEEIERKQQNISDAKKLLEQKI